MRPKSFDIIHAVSEFYGVNVSDLMGQRRTKEIAHARQVAFAVYRRVLNLPLSEIGRAIGGRDHTTVLHGLRAVEERGQYQEVVDISEEIAVKFVVFKSTRDKTPVFCSTRAAI